MLTVFHAVSLFCLERLCAVSCWLSQNWVCIWPHARRWQRLFSILLPPVLLTTAAMIQRRNIFPQKLVSHGGLDVCSRCLAPFEISVLADRRTALAVSISLGHPLLLSPPLLSPLKDNWFLLVLRARHSLLAPFEIGYKTVDQCICESSATKQQQKIKVFFYDFQQFPSAIRLLNRHNPPEPPCPWLQELDMLY